VVLTLPRLEVLPWVLGMTGPMSSSSSSSVNSARAAAAGADRGGCDDPATPPLAGVDTGRPDRVVLLPVGAGGGCQAALAVEAAVSEAAEVAADGAGEGGTSSSSSEDRLTRLARLMQEGAAGRGDRRRQMTGIGCRG
jgi:hypothetical protein